MRNLKFFTIIMTLLLPLITVGADTDGDGLADDYELGAGRYQVVLGSFSWQDAKADAERHGGHLATIISTNEWLAIQEVLAGNLANRNLWLGGTDEGTENQWRWVTGERFTYTGWAAGESNNGLINGVQGAPQNFLILETSVASQGWNDVTATAGNLKRDGYILEYSAYTDRNNKDSDADGLTDDRERLTRHGYLVLQYPGGITWEASRDDAVRRGGHILIVETPEEFPDVLAIWHTNGGVQESQGGGNEAPHGIACVGFDPGTCKYVTGMRNRGWHESK